MTSSEEIVLVRGFVTAINGNSIWVDHQCFTLTDPTSGFIPIEGDKVRVHSRPAENTESPTTERVEQIVQVFPGRSRTFCGCITRWDPRVRHGEVNAIPFGDNCVMPYYYTPVIGDLVYCSSVFNRFSQTRIISLVKDQLPEICNVVVYYPRVVNLVVGQGLTVDFSLLNRTSRELRFECTVINHCPHEFEIMIRKPGPRILNPYSTSLIKLHGACFCTGVQCATVKFNFYSFIFNKPITFITKNELDLFVSESSSFSVPRDYMIPDNIAEFVMRTNMNNERILQLARRALPVLKQDLRKKNYAEIMHTYLFLQEAELMKSVKTLTSAVTFRKQDNLFVLEYPLGSEFGRFSVGDKVHLFQSPQIKENSMNGIICRVGDTQLSVRFDTDVFDLPFIEVDKDCVAFSINRAPFLRKHSAIDLMVHKNGLDYIFPPPFVYPYGKYNPRTGRVKWNPEHLSVSRCLWFNPFLDDDQKAAVEGVMMGYHAPYPYIILGPPGTGKTSTVIELITQTVALHPESRILICTPTNLALDSIAVDLSNSNIPYDCFVRLTSHSWYVDGDLNEALFNMCYVPSCEGGPNITHSHRDLSKYRVILSTYGFVTFLQSASLCFTHIILDEAGQITEPECLSALALGKGSSTHLIFSGDPLQLGPVIKSKLCKQLDLSQSMLARMSTWPMYQKSGPFYNGTFMSDSKYITKLTRNYRSLPKLVNLISSIFYDGILRPTKSDTESIEANILKQLTVCSVPLGLSMTSCIFINIPGEETKLKGCSSTFNVQEIEKIAGLLTELYDQNIAPRQIGIISPYTLQVKKVILRLLQSNIQIPKVATIEEFQGLEKDIIIISLVKSKLTKFVKSSHRINVALSRAKVLTIILGNAEALQKTHLFKMILSRCLCI